MKKKALGFTFIEIMVVLIIIGIVASFAILSINSFNNKPSLNDLGENLRLRVKAAELQAILKPAVLRLRINKNGFQFQQQVIEENNSTNWLPLKSDKLSDPSAFQGFQIVFPNASESVQDIIFNPNGSTTDFAFDIQDKGKILHWHLLGNGEIECATTISSSQTSLLSQTA